MPASPGKPVGFRLPPGFKVGAATAATQIEGGDIAHSWSDWADRGHVKDGSSPRRAGNHWQLWRQDADLMIALGLQCYRLSVEWARLEPAPGQFDESALQHYRDEIDYLRAAGIEVLVTLHHFTDPLWFVRAGGFEHPGNVNAFLRFADYVVSGLGERVDRYVTINEPNVYAFLGYLAGIFPPGVKSLPRMARVMSVLAACHIETYRLIHRRRAELGLPPAEVGFAHHVRAFAPRLAHHPWHRAAAHLNEWAFQTALAQAGLLGRFRPPLTNLRHLPPGEYADFLGINYYTRSTVSGLGDGVRAGAPVNDLGWEIYPAGLVEEAAKVYQLLPRPIAVTENGTCDNTDRFRSRYIYDHLQVIAQSTLPFSHYYHWCFCDNFEWAEGESARFGLVHTDFATNSRQVKPAGEFLAGLIAAGGVDETLWSRYVEGQHYDKFAAA